MLKTQVHYATYDKEDKRLPYLNRSYISFSYGGKFIEDFQLLATMENRFKKNIYADFEDSTSNYVTMSGQYYWGTHYTNNHLDFILSTDGMTQENLEDFRIWFKPGVERLLILAEHPNRAIFARISTPPSLSVIPFEQEVMVVVDGQSYQTTTTLYKGNINLSFIMDEPFWHGILNYMPSYVNIETLEEVNINEIPQNELNSNSLIVNTLSDKSMLRVYLEDRIPYQNSLFDPNEPNIKYFLGNYSMVDTQSRTVTSYNNNPIKDATGIYDNDLQPNTTYTMRTRLGVLMKQLKEEEGVLLNSSTKQYLFYSGTAPSAPIIKFSIVPDIVNNYIVNPRNHFASPTSTTNSYIQIGEHKFIFKLPAIWNGYNQAISIIESFKQNDSFIELKNQLRDKITEYYSRAFVMECIDKLNKTDDSLTYTDLQNLITLIKQFILGADQSGKATFMFDSKTGEAIGEFNCLNAIEVNESSGLYTVSPIKVRQNVGDMVYSNYLIIDKRNKLDQDGRVVLSNCTEISTNENLIDFLILYDNMYL